MILNLMQNLRKLSFAYPAVVFRLLGYVLLCGVLHVAYQSDDRVEGQYMICVLYKSCLVLATTNRVFTPYNVVATIALANGTVEEPDNGRGTYIKFYLSFKRLTNPRTSVPYRSTHVETRLRIRSSTIRNHIKRLFHNRGRTMDKTLT